ncbi:MAG: LCP family protein [Acetatifactor sp.]|nr:LCP family protein [Acetatifactor sp.]
MARQSANKPATRQGASVSRAGAGKPGRKKQPTKKKKHKGIRRFLTVVVVLLLAVTALWYVTVSKLYDKMEYAPAEILADEPMKEDGVTNILLIGNDSRAGGEDGRSDAMILVSISNRTKTIYMTSLLRDIYVEIPGHESNRLNAAYAFGGPELLLETIKQNLDIEVNRYVQVNFQAFANLIDAVGGVELELTNEEVQLVNAYLNEYNMLENRPIDTDYLPADASGLLHLNGPQALAYSRNRYIGSDFGRTERQRKILEAVFHQLPSSMLTNSGDMIDGILPNLTTNISKSECYTLSLDAPKLLTYEIVQASIPIEGSYQNATIRKMSVLQVDFEKNKEFIRTHIYGEQEGE